MLGRSDTERPAGAHRGDRGCVAKSREASSVDGIEGELPGMRREIVAVQSEGNPMRALGARDLGEAPGIEDEQEGP
jgi:hypothetical protein